MKNKKEKNIIVCMIIIVFIILIITMSMFIVNNKDNSSIDKGSNLKMENTNNIVEWVKTEDDGKKINESKEINSTKEFEGLTLKTQQFVSKNSKTEMAINVTNETEKDIELQLVVIILLDKEGKEMVKLNGIINSTKSGESTNLYISSSLDYVDDYKIEKLNI